MVSFDEKAMDNLLEDEKLALGLQLGLNKSSWESGEIMGRSHYKYLEIKYRAEKFIKMFSEFYSLYDEILPSYLEAPNYVLKYLHLCISKRMKPAMALIEINKERRVLKHTMNERLIEVIRHWDRTSNTNPHHGQALNLVKEFDRWNNFRILPKSIQEPSAYKRRLKNYYKKHLKILIQIPEISIAKLRSLYEVKKGNYYYWPYITKNGWEIIKVKNTKTAYNTFCDISLYLFKEKDMAEQYIKASYIYLSNPDRDCKDGLDFWPIYRDMIKKAVNYQIIQNIIPKRKYLDTALQNLQFI